MRQDKAKELEFFDGYATAEQTYNVFTDASNERLIRTCIELGRFEPGARIVDLGCGSGTFTAILAGRGYRMVGLDLSAGLIAAARKSHPGIEFLVGDVESLPFATGSVDRILLSGLVHHLPDPSRCAAEVHRILRPRGVFVAFDPNRLNPMMYLYRDKSSPFYSSKGVTENERPIIFKQVARIFEQVGFRVEGDYLSGLQYQYVASSAARFALPIYNAFDAVLSHLPFLKRHYSFVLTKGTKS